ncbi:MAG: hypothetical protein J7M18_05760 [Candidatus Eremiobacteraeota bacterium]|nr:hypothetical protein [Candidatus Eremiobacteraeota bacterium]
MKKKKTGDNTTFVHINSELEGMRVVSILEEHGIPARYISQQIPMYDDILVPAQGFWGEILVPVYLHEKARLVLKRVFSRESDKYKKEKKMPGSRPEYMISFIGPGYPNLAGK